MNIGILTFSKGDNYGAVLQSYALGQWLRSKGHNVEYINYTWSTLRYRITSNLTPLKKRFEIFRNKYLINFSKECNTKEDLTEAIKEKDLVIVGSDQVWNPDITGYRAKHYFLDFVPYSIPKIAYAASFGKSQWEWPELTDEVNILLQKFKSISVREEDGARICKKIFGVDAKVVLDPTFLINNYDSLLRKPKYANRIVGFHFYPSNSYYKLLKELGQIRQKRILVMDLPSRHTTMKVLEFSISPFCKVTDWLTNIAYADFVVTDSFHCLAFSLIFKRQFIFIATNSRLVSRISTLLDKLEIKNRVYFNHQDAIDAIPTLTFIDYKKVDRKIEEYRTESENFLFNVFNSINHEKDYLNL